MIFYFSGTGNSLHVAECIAKETGENLVCMTEAELQQQKTYTIEENESLGFVFPIYWWGMPVEAERFVQRMQLSYNRLTYTYAVCTYGMVEKNGMKDLQKCLTKKQIHLDATYEVKMVDNYIVGYELVKEEKQQKILRKAEVEIQQIAAAIRQKKQDKIRDLLPFMKPIVHKCYQIKDHKRKFHVTQECIQCGKCQKECPSGAIRMIEGKPQWEQNCSFCLKCIHSCPVQAVQYGKTEGRKRYQYSEHLINNN